MLWNTDGFAEDALANLFFALEGCLLLFQETAGGPTKKLDRKLLRRIFSETYQHGESLYDFIEEPLGWGGTRARIVHPQLSLVEGWTPFLMAEDFMDFRRVIMALLTYLVTGESVEDYPTL